MNDFLDTNRDWIFSGVGVTAITAIFSIISSVATYLIQNRNYNRSRKKALIKKDLKRYEIETDDIPGNVGNLVVSYNGRPCEILCRFTVTIRNIGLPAIRGQQLLFSFPENCSILEDAEPNRNTGVIIVEREELQSNGKTEHLYEIQVLEREDNVSISYILDTVNAEELRCEPRGVDEIDYNFSEFANSSDISVLIALFALFVMSGAVPIIGNIFKAGVILAASPYLVRIIQNLIDFLKQENSIINLRDISIAEGGKLDIFQQD